MVVVTQGHGCYLFRSYDSTRISKVDVLPKHITRLKKSNARELSLLEFKRLECWIRAIEILVMHFVFFQKCVWIWNYPGCSSMTNNAILHKCRKHYKLIYLTVAAKHIPNLATGICGNSAVCIVHIWKYAFAKFLNFANYFKV